MKITKETFFIYLLCLAGYTTRSQELEPRAYAALPKNLNSMAVAYGLSNGNVLTDPALPIAGLKITTQNITASYVHSFAIGSRLARLQVSIPFVHISGKLQINGRDTSGTRNGFGDPKIRFGVNLTGTPVLDKRSFTQYTQKTIVGVSLVVSLPTGSYKNNKRINIGSHRWAFKPEAGVSKRFKRLYAELYSGVWFYTVNPDYLVNKSLRQDPVFNIQAHASWYFKNHMWVSVNANWFNGGKTSVDDIPAGEQMDNSRIGATWSLPLAKGQSLKLQFHTGIFTAGNYHYKVVLLAYQYVF